jgi:methyltransferase-like protein/SAM-dependent methyltransferase
LNSAAIPLACRAELLLGPLKTGQPGRYAVHDLRTGDRYALGDPEYFLLAQLDGARSAPDICRTFEERFGQSLSEEELNQFVELANTRGFLRPVAAPEGALAGDPARVSDNTPCSSTPGGETGSGAAPSCYDEVPYASRPFPQTHPDNLATVATLFGMKPPPVERCRVLELGCAAGGNLVPLAVTLPEGRFVGIDLSGRQIADGLRVVKALGLRNVELRHLSILDVGAELGEFDYILCHGVYSWVPAAVREKILDICARHLGPNGVAFVSYNTNPGWHLPSVIRAMMRFHTDRFSEPAVRIRQARALLEFFAGAGASVTDGYDGALRKELELLRGVPDHYLFHEYLAEENAPVYFHEFNARAEERGLQYLGEAAFLEMLTDHFPPDVARTLELLAPELVQTEQYIDFLRNRRFRQTLLCHRGVPLNRSLGLEVVERLHVSSAFRPVPERPDIHSDAVVEFRTARGLPLTVGDPLVKAALVHLAEVWPAAVPFRDLPAAARARLGHGSAAPVADSLRARLLLASLLKGAAPGAVEFSVNPPRLVVNVSAQPVASPLARLQAATNSPVVNLRHQVVPLNASERLVLRHLDGTHDRARLARVLAAEAARADQGADELLDQCLRRLAHLALLAG